MKKKLSIFAILLVLSAIGQAQTLNKLFQKYADDNRFEYLSIGKGMLGFASIFADYGVLTDGQMEKITGVKMLKLEKDSANMELASKFVKEIDVIIKKGNFEVSLIKRDKNQLTYIYKRIDKRANADMLLFTRSNSLINFVWLMGKASDEEADRYNYEKEQQAKEEKGVI
ncbi:MAG: DUF4252 domain-containing protein [Paludibacteraceae bacterium]